MGMTREEQEELAEARRAAACMAGALILRHEELVETVALLKATTESVESTLEDMSSAISHGLLRHGQAMEDARKEDDLPPVIELLQALFGGTLFHASGDTAEEVLDSFVKRASAAASKAVRSEPHEKADNWRVARDLYTMASAFAHSHAELRSRAALLRSNANECNNSMVEANVNQRSRN